jgi:hypothetical protein
MRMSKLIDKPWKVMVTVGVEGIVAGLIGWLAIEFLPSPTGEAVYYAMLVLFSCGAGITVIVYGNVTKNINFYILGFGLLLLALFIVIDRYEGFAVKISAFATLILAFAAFVSIYVTIGEGRRARQYSIERESSDRKERLIDEVAKWLRELEGYIFKPLAVASRMEDKIMKMPKIPEKTWVASMSLDLAFDEIDALDRCIREARYYKRLTSQLDETLSGSIEVVMDYLEQRRKLHFEAPGGQLLDYDTEDKEYSLVKELVEKDDKPVEGSGVSERNIIVVRFYRNKGAIKKSILEAFDRAIELKGSFIDVG